MLPSLQIALPTAVAAITATLFVKTWRRDLPTRKLALILVALAALGLAGIGALVVGGDAERKPPFEPLDS